MQTSMGLMIISVHMHNIEINKMPVLFFASSLRVNSIPMYNNYVFSSE